MKSETVQAQLQRKLVIERAKLEEKVRIEYRKERGRKHWEEGEQI